MSGCGEEKRFMLIKNLLKVIDLLIELINELKKPQKGCCKANTAKCLACASGMSIEEYCINNPSKVGCEEYPRICCMAYTANCLACAAGMSLEDYCRDNPNIPGCPRNCIKKSSKI